MKEALASPKDAALKLALESMKRIDAWLIQRGYTGLMPQEKEVITSIESALAQQEQEPVGYVQTVIEALYENGDPISVDAAELLQRISAQPEQEPVAWQPIETAPKDGSMILICLPRQMNLVVRGWYNNIHRFWQVDYESEGGITRPMYVHEGDLWHPIPPLYTTPPQRTWGKPWVSLTDDEIWKFWCSRPEVSEGEDDSMEAEFVTAVRAVLAAHGIKEKNT